MGYAIAAAGCMACGRTFWFNPVKVPSLNGQPVCESCMKLVNERRIARGDPPHPIHPAAYQECDESELGG